MIIDNLELFKTYIKDEQRLVWVLYKANLITHNFIDNDEVSNTFFVSNENKINKEQLRGKLTEQLFYDIIKSR